MLCSECGITANALQCIKKFGRPPKQLAFSISTFHNGKCDCCGEIKHVTENRDFFYPDISLIAKVTKFLSK